MIEEYIGDCYDHFIQNLNISRSIVIKNPEKNLLKFKILFHEEVCEMFSVSYEETFSTSRKRDLVQARQFTTTILLACHETTIKASGFFNRDHATAIHSRKMTRTNYMIDYSFRAIVDFLIQKWNVQQAFFSECLFTKDEEKMFKFSTPDFDGTENSKSID